VARRCVPGQAVLAAALGLLNGEMALVAMGQSDVGLFLALSWGLLAALLYGRFRCATVLAIVCALARPEGMVLAAGLAVLVSVLGWRRAILPRLRAGDVSKSTAPTTRHPPAVQIRSLAFVAGAGLLAAAAVLGLNYFLTGIWQFQSVVGKGCLSNFPLLGALGCAANEFLVLVREVLFNLGTAPRQNYFLPVLGGGLAIVGLSAVFSHRVGTARRAVGGAFGENVQPCETILIWWLGCCLAALGLISLGGFQGMGNDRYLAWMLPTWMLLGAAGVGQVARLTDTRRSLVALGVVLLGFEIAAWPYFLARYATQVEQMQAMVSFGETVQASEPPDAPIGMLVGTGLRYYFGDRPIRHLNGIMSSDFRGQRDLVCSIESLRHESKLRFAYWLVPPALQGWCNETGLLGPCALTDTDGASGEFALNLFQASWDSAPAASLRPLDAAVTNALAAMRLVDQLDVGYVPDERRCHYQTGSRLPDARFLPFASCRRLGSIRITEVGQPVIGWDAFHIAAPLRQKPLRVVMRTTRDATCTVVRSSTRNEGEGIHLHSPLRLQVLVHGVALPAIEVTVDCADDAFAECKFEIPAEFVTTSPLDIVIGGDHIALAYWFYQ